MSEPPSLRRDAVAVWRAGVAAVDSERLVRNCVEVDGASLVICGHETSLDRLKRIAVVGAGKAGAGMAAGFEAALGIQLVRKHVVGWVNVPADCVRRLERVHLHAARPAGHNEPTQAGVDGAQQILEIVSQLGSDDVCVVLISGGGSALLPAPAETISLADKQSVTKLLMHSGASIEDLNCVRKHLSRIKGGRLARACGASLTVSLIISDVVGDRLETIASGPTVPDSTAAADALEILGRYATSADDVPRAVTDYLKRVINKEPAPPFPSTVHNHVIGSNRIALEAAAERATALGYGVYSLGSESRGEARAVGMQLADLCRSVRDRGDPLEPPACILSGGEPVVHLRPTDRPRKGGRNQELVLAALEKLWDDGMDRVALLSGGTDGEDGPTDAAGAVADAELWRTARGKNLNPAEYLAINNSYAFFEEIGGLLKTGPTHTNVMDLRVVLIAALPQPSG